MTTTDLPHPGPELPQPEGEPEERRRPSWIKLILLLILLVCLGWVVLLIFQYCRTGEPIGRLPGVPGDVAGLFKEPPRYVQSVAIGVQRPLGVAVAPDGKVVVTESGGERLIHVFDVNGEEIAAFAPHDAPAATRAPVYVAVSPQGEIFVSDRDARTIYICSTEGELIGEVPSPFPEGQWHPLGLAFDGDGNLYVTDVTTNKHRVVVFDSSWEVKLEFGTQGSENGEFWFPNALAIDDEGRIFVSDSNNGRIQVFDGSGEFLYRVGRGLSRGDLSMPRGIALDNNDHLFVADTSRQVVQVYNVSESPQYLHTFGGNQADDSLFRYPNGLAITDDYRVYVTDRENNRVQVWSY
jgi:DNA-binding beta-propeller fold protein YncE